MLAFLEEGAFFGEMALLTGDRRSTDVQAASELTLLELDARTSKSGSRRIPSC